MKRLITLLILLTFSIPCLASFGTATAWDVQTTGSDTNGGAFDSGVGSPGTDESVGAGAAITVTLTGTTTGTASPAFTSTTHGPGNFVHIASGTGCTVGWYEVTSQASGTATFDHAMGASTNVCTGTIGGSLATPITPINLAVGGNTVWVKAGTYTQTVTNTISNGSLAGSVTLTVTGYASAHGDDGTAPLLTTSTNSVNIFNFTAADHSATFVFKNINLGDTAGTSGVGFQNFIGTCCAYTLTLNKVTTTGLVSAINGDDIGSNGVWNQINFISTNPSIGSGIHIAIQSVTAIISTTIVQGNYGVSN